MSENIKKLGIPTATIATALMLMAPAILSTGAFAIPPETTTTDRGLKFVGQPQLTVNKVVDESGRVTSASLTATGEVSGAGTGGTATLSATAVVTQGCLNKGGNEPKGLQETEEEVIGEAELDITRPGRGTFDVTTTEITAPSEGFTCPSANMTPVLVSVDFTDIVLTITTDEGKEITATFADQDP